MTELKGKPVADGIIAASRGKMEQYGVTPVLAIVRVGARPDDLAYERGIIRTFDRADAKVEIRELPEDVSQEDFDKTFDEVNEDPGINAILVMRPLPKTLSAEHAMKTIDPGKDVDLMNPAHMTGILEGKQDAYAPCTAAAVIEILDYYDIPISGKKAAVIGRSLVIGKPVSLLLMNRDATVATCHRKTPDTEGICRDADIVVAAAGRAGMMTADYVRPGQVVIDVGMNLDDNGNLTGDADYDKVSKIVDAITPVPGGVGAVTTSVLLKYTTDNAVRMQK
ncbi:MAG: bifunctional 5,10-methylenetetrahydrofolate dehydrogenase/5,10-methenyltetrahydrofolate cyclohydrolase [Clostridiales bacterium]|nr:bifunctional 5,10-methylenetetrahydrofolate dehydrogenase/5,10-methenyltetrahydrofolate cyclohydrolase [Clostridiales bacterium]